MSLPIPNSMSDSQWIWQCDHEIPSRPEASRRVQDEILEQMERLRWGEHDVFSVRLAMEEALINAIKHGNHYDPGKNVHVRCGISSGLLRIEIEDEGRGFDLAAVPDPTDPDNLESPCGRGIMLMRSFMSRVEFNEVGNAVVLEKDMSPPE
jgi:serine/threonine-protein kinase RsbW